MTASEGSARRLETRGDRRRRPGAGSEPVRAHFGLVVLTIARSLELGMTHPRARVARYLAPLIGAIFRRRRTAPPPRSGSDQDTGCGALLPANARPGTVPAGHSREWLGRGPRSSIRVSRRTRGLRSRPSARGALRASKDRLRGYGQERPCKTLDGAPQQTPGPSRRHSISHGTSRRRPRPSRDSAERVQAPCHERLVLDL